ncbi:hypothetical protein F5878DRAFT_660284 [Lentinula raphanica]|uniref:DUF6533 domain-containing protein n=1 Tax=Lentinula raphanica TaxID=153919 RepID=A0AA38PAP7_9AGAR|nr:hypothetical protein F5878DRAFT_660284 [Lentinula raphanica]
MSTSDTGTVVSDTHYLQYDVTWASIGNHPSGCKDLLHALNINFTALLYYDWALTFPDEVEYIWKAGMTFPTILYVFCRYALLANVMYLLEISNLLGSRVSPSHLRLDTARAVTVGALLKHQWLTPPQT